MERCLECGAVNTPLTGGVCTWRTGCEHRTLQHEAEMGRLNAQLARLDVLPCGHSEADHDHMRLEVHALLRSFREGYQAEDDWPPPLDEGYW